MEVYYERCCGIDVHKKILVTCLRIGDKQITKSFGSSTSDLRSMADWLLENNCQMVAMESTGSYWKPVFNVLEVLGLDVMVVNARHMRNVSRWVVTMIWKRSPHISFASLTPISWQSSGVTSPG